MGCCGGGIFSRGYRQSSQGASAPIKQQADSPVDTLKKRLANGEISVEEYQKLFVILQQEDVPMRL
ncbi:SHOCT domain-containing protein [Ferroacidibacillus organovorans]|uniref:SHOCT domain-containing protein n=1 Tax=Ferroacidibacillus organovorans TaxID=1765683 RepID=A0A101XTI8_9BACL|nr:SHOCT domain-containing protein [Ferroacidibacillus organovorans]KUO97245.1 hypothetical protein ATW55_11665 [Ferroacidibacillus organovorans]